MENIWTKLSNELAEVAATAGKSVVAILGKLHAGSRTEAVSLGIRKGLIPI